MSVYDTVLAYHRVHGDDVNSEQSRQARYDAILGLIPKKSDRTLLDVGCGSQRFRARVPRMEYTGIDLVFGQNVMDETRHFDVVIANGCLYKLPDQHAARELLHHCWSLCEEAFVWTSLDYWLHYHPDELALDPYDSARWASKIAPGIVLDLSYKPGDFAIAMYRA